MKLSDGEKLIIAMLCDIYKRQKIKGDIDPDFVRAAISGGHSWALEWQYPGVLHPHEDEEETVKEVVDVLDMWSILEGSLQKLPKPEKARVEKEAAPLGKKVKFLGFDGNNEAAHLGIAQLLIHHMDRFGRYKARQLNSHAQLLPGYRRMLNIFLPMRASLHEGRMSADQIIEVLKAG
jgi:uncharacterized protein